MSDDKEKIETIKASVSMPADLWTFVQEQAGPYGKNSPVIQDAIRQMRDRIQAEGAADLKKATNPIKYKATRRRKK